MPAGNTISHVDEGPISPASRKYGRLTVVPSVSMFSRAWGWPSTMSCVAAGSGVARAGFVDASNDSVPVFETLCEQGRKREIVGRFRLAGVRVRDVQRAAIRTAFGDGDGSGR